MIKADEPTRWQPGDALSGDFVIEKHLGRGGMGDVYLARSRSSGKRFAVKRVLPKYCAEARHRREFLAELRTWQELPDHPNLAACRFFRTIGGETCIFAEYVDGGSLSDWIRSGRPTRLAEILDMAIQFAWGLQAAHRQGLVHQDVKPGNVLMTPDGVPKVTDFGLAKVRARTEEATPIPEQPTAPRRRSLLLRLFGRGADGDTADDATWIESTGAAPLESLVSCGGMTPAYCSPEQAQRLALSKATDQWSWGVSVLEMFCGGVTWPSGAVAAQVLESRLKGAKRHAAALRVAMPGRVADVLRRSFQRDPADRWASMDDAAEALIGAYRKDTGRLYARQRPNVSTVPAAAEHDRRTVDGVAWADPMGLFKNALEAAGRDPSEAERLIRRGPGSRQAQAIDDLIVYEEVLVLYTRLVASDRKDLEPDLATFCIYKAFLHSSAGDTLGEIAMYDKAIKIRERLVHQQGRRELANDLAWCYNNKGNAVRALGDNRAAVALYEKAIEIRERLVHQEGRRELAGDLAWVQLYWADIANKLGQHDQAKRVARQAVETLESEIARTGRADLQGVLDWARKNLGDLL